MLTLDAKFYCAMTLTALAILLTGCATSSQPSAAICPYLPPMPAVSEPIPSQTYSVNAQLNIDRWLKSLTDTSTTSAP